MRSPFQAKHINDKSIKGLLR